MNNPRTTQRAGEPYPFELGQDPEHGNTRDGIHCEGCGQDMTTGRDVSPIGGYRPPFHAGKGRYFERFDGGVAFYFLDAKGEMRDSAWFDKDTWASIVAHVSSRGGTSDTVAEAKRIHDGDSR